MAIKRNVAHSLKNSVGAESDQIQVEQEESQPAELRDAQAATFDADEHSTPLKKTMMDRFKKRMPVFKTPRSAKPKQADTIQADNVNLSGKKSDLTSNKIPAQNESPSVEPVATVHPVDHEKGGWISPAYMNSRSVKLNPQTLADNRCVGYQHEAPELEYYRMLRTHIIQQTGGKGNTIMVTSAGPGEGKTLTAINLAFTFAREYKQTALLVDCDLRRQQIYERLGYPSDKGLADYLIDDVPFSDLVVWPGVEKLTVISGGKTVKDSSELLGSLGMKNLVMDMKTRYPERYVIFDVPPLLTCADSLAFAPMVDYVLVVVQVGKTSLQDVNKALNLLPSEKVLGLVMNRQHNLM
jgi:non-specific protein-tyrosine kinase